MSRHATETEETNILNEHNMVNYPNWKGGRPVGYMGSVIEV